MQLLREVTQAGANQVVWGEVEGQSQEGAAEGFQHLVEAGLYYNRRVRKLGRIISL